VRLVVHRRRPFAAVLAVSLLAAGLATGGWWALERERARISASVATALAERDTIAKAKSALEAERKTLVRRIAILERARQVEAQAYSRVDRQLAALQDQLLSLKEEIAFYRGIVSEDAGSDEVRIQRFVVEREGSGPDYRFRLVLTRGMRSDKVASGAVSVAVDGDRDGERVQLSLEELTPFPVGPLEYSFKHFQRIEGRLRLPDRFVPRRVVVQLDETAPGGRPLRETFQWPSMKS
jgi:hypothetical protein